MLFNLRTRIGPQPKTNPFRTQTLLTLQMSTQSTSSKRPICPSCSKPAVLCLCTRLKTRTLQNSVAVTILQHSLEKKHPLNSARIAKLGLMNVDIFSVSDVNTQARFDIRLLDPGIVSFEENENYKNTQRCSRVSNSRLSNGERVILQLRRSEYVDEPIMQCGDVKKLEFGELLECPEERNNGVCDTNEELSVRMYSKSKFSQCFDSVREASIGINGPDIGFSIGKYGSISSFMQCCMRRINREVSNFDDFCASPIAYDVLRTGFVVKKLHNKEMNGDIGDNECEEFEITVPPGSVLLFPSEKSVGEIMDFEVKNLIVLDGTWAKAKRMYNENPWLKFLPHFKLDPTKLSLYGEVRHQPRAGYLSTIESIVYALKAVGDDFEGLDDLLDVFESMVGDQRRCKVERLSKTSVV